MSLPRYPQYKPSGVEWLGEIPAHWEVISIKWLSPVKRGASPRPIDDPKYFDDEGEFAWVRIADVSACNGVLNETTQRLSELGSSLSVKIAPGELFVSIAGTVGKPCIAGINACIHDGFVYFPTLRINPLFLYRIFEAGVCFGGLGKWGTQLNLNTDTIGSIRVAMPPTEELEVLLAFLDRETAKIDVLVEAQELLVELLKEKRQALITHAVTKGLDPNVPMKDSGVEWLREIPKDWDVCAPKWRIKSSAGGTIIKGTCADDPADGLFPGFSASGQNIWLEEYAYDGPAIVLSAVGARCGKAFKADGKWGVVANTHCLFPRPNSDRDYLWYLTNQESWWEKGGSAQPFVKVSDTLARPWVFPPLGEQKAIVTFLDRETARLDELTSEAHRAIALLKERRAALITAAVTGQIDVRGVVAQEAT
jgi:type I restriction enzyme S subunit